jgi:predicted transcriptional regulator
MPDENDFAFVDALCSLGANRNVATLITYLKEVPEATSRDIELATNLRQPEVSIAVKNLRQQGWIAERDIKREGKGRPMKVYSLKPRVDEIIKFYEEEQLRASVRMMQVFSRLKELSSTA